MGETVPECTKHAAANINQMNVNVGSHLREDAFRFLRRSLLLCVLVRCAVRFTGPGRVFVYAPVYLSARTPGLLEYKYM